VEGTRCQGESIGGTEPFGAELIGGDGIRVTDLKSRTPGGIEMTSREMEVDGGLLQIVVI
jgi:hypothetical protein